jgi:hypothetical protein
LKSGTAVPWNAEAAEIAERRKMLVFSADSAISAFETAAS